MWKTRALEKERASGCHRACDEDAKFAPFLLRSLHGAPIRFEFKRLVEGNTEPRGFAQTDTS